VTRARSAPATRPRRHFGSVRKLPSGRWQASFWHDGQRHTGSDTFTAKADALAYLANTETDLQRGQWIDPAAGKVTLSKYATEWLDGRSDLRETTRAKYDHLLKNHILPKLGSTPISSLAPSKVRSWYHELARRHSTTADDAYRLLRAVLNVAKADRQIGSNPCQVKGAGQVHSPERPVASVRDVARAVEAVPERYRLALLLPAWCQLRRGEVLGLQRRDVDLLHSTIRIERTRIAPMRGKSLIGPPKTEAGARTLTIPPNVVPVIVDHLERFVGPEPTAWLFSTSAGLPLSPRNLNRAWDKARRAAGRPDLHLHDLRHSGLTWAAASGASVAELMRRGGHANPQAALRYQHATEDRDRALAEALGKLAEVAEITPLAVPSGSASRT
jgi:integrase